MATTKQTFIDIFNTGFTVGGETVQLKKIIIPIIQRDYAQGRRDEESSRVRTRFLKALYEAVTETPITLDFVYGDIDENGVMTPLDGQQRLTTLFLLHWYAAKRDKVEADECGFLKNFSYETRYSARDFCSYLIGFTPSCSGPVSKEIMDESWFPLDWNKDSTIAAMLVMLDAIQVKFTEVDELWEKLKAGAISFYFLPIKDMGLTNELYIKMNSRGKPLTTFEHFKAELEHEMKQVDDEICKRIMRKIDIEWTDLLWNYRGSDNVIDDEFLCYLRFICDIICYKNDGTMQGKRMTEFDLLEKYFAAKNEKAKENILLMESFFDIWCMDNLNERPRDFIMRFISTQHEHGKIVFENKPDLFDDCIRNYADVYGGRNRGFPLNRIILLYAIVVYLLNKDTISEEEFARRLRVIHNLTRNSDDEISDSTQRTSGNRMPAILKQVDSIILNGVVDHKIENNFNVYQLSEEAEKLVWVTNHQEHSEELFELEDHELLFGQVGIVDLDHPEYFKKFQKLFECKKDAIDCALLMQGDYGQKDRNGWRYQMGSSDMPKAWINLFHNGAAIGIRNTRAALKKLLQINEPYSDEMLYQMKDDYIKECEENNEYDWRYYYVKYPEAFRPGRYGKICWENKTEAPYELMILYAELYLSQNSYQPFLKLMDESALSRDEMGQFLLVGDYWIECANDGFYLHNMSDNEVVEILKINQNEAGIDTEDRVRKAMKWYKRIMVTE